MFDIAVYYSCLPRIADRDRKVQVMKAFADGGKNLGMKVCEQMVQQVVPARLSVIIGWYGKVFKGPHIHLRKAVIDNAIATGNHVMPIDGSCFKWADVNSQFLRYSLNGVWYDQSEYANKLSDHVKWKTVSRTLGLRMKPYRQQDGEHILVCLQRDGGWNMKASNLQDWTRMTVKRIRDVTDRPILIREHPKFKMDLGRVLKFRDTYVSKGTTLKEDCEKAHAAVFFNSSSSVAAALEGIPVFVSDTDAVTYKVANTDLTKIEKPNMPDRKQWIYDLAACHWTDEESRNGDIIRKFQKFM